MESEIIKFAFGQGFGYALFVWLLFYVLKENSKREQNYQDIIKQLTETLKEIPGIKDALHAIKKHLKID